MLKEILQPKVISVDGELTEFIMSRFVVMVTNPIRATGKSTTSVLLTGSVNHSSFVSIST